MVDFNTRDDVSRPRSNKYVVFRLRGMSATLRDDAELQSALLVEISTYLTPEESVSISISIEVVPSCYDSGNKVGIMDVYGGVPSFLSNMVGDPLQEIHIEMDEDDITIDCNFFGFTQLYNSAVVKDDIIAITGLNGHAYGSWMGKGALSRMWLRDFLRKDLPYSRVMIYGYNSKLTGKGRGLERLMDYGRSLLEEMKEIRKSDLEKRRPIFFIAHSFGGNILAHAMIKASLPGNLSNNSIYNAIYGILFFGTPHKGLKLENVRMLLQDPEHPRHELLSQIELNSDLLFEQLADFRNIIQDRKIVSFYEVEQTQQLATDSTGGPLGRTGKYTTAVPVDSALLHLPDRMETKIPLSADHSMMVKFDSREDKGYRITKGKLQEFERDAVMTVSTPFQYINDIATEPIAGVSEGRRSASILEIRHVEVGQRQRILHDTTWRAEEHMGNATIAQYVREEDNAIAEWPMNLFSSIPLQEHDRQERSKEFLSKFRRLNVQVSQMSKNARQRFRADLEADELFLETLSRAKVDFEAYRHIQRELSIYLSDKADDEGC